MGNLFKVTVEVKKSFVEDIVVEADSPEDAREYLATNREWEKDGLLDFDNRQRVDLKLGPSITGMFINKAPLSISIIDNRDDIPSNYGLDSPPWNGEHETKLGEMVFGSYGVEYSEDDLSRSAFNIGVFWEGGKDYKDALFYYKLALELYGDVGGEDPVKKGQILFRIGRAHNLVGNRDKSSKFLNEALALFDGVDNEYHSKMVSEELSKIERPSNS